MSGAIVLIVSAAALYALLTMPQWLFDEDDERPPGPMGWLFDRWRGEG